MTELQEFHIGSSSFTSATKLILGSTQLRNFVVGNFGFENAELPSMSEWKELRVFEVGSDTFTKTTAPTVFAGYLLI